MLPIPQQQLHTPFVADFGYPCAVYSAVWLIQQANPGVNVYNFLQPWDIRNFLALIGFQEIGGREAFTESFEEIYMQLGEFCIQNGLLVPEVTTFYVNSRNQLSPRQLVNQGSIDPNTYTAIYYPGHWLVVGPETTPGMRNTFTRFRRRQGWFGPL